MPLANAKQKMNRCKIHKVVSSGKKKNKKKTTRDERCKTANGEGKHKSHHEIKCHCTLNMNNASGMCVSAYRIHHLCVCVIIVISIINRCIWLVLFLFAVRSVCLYVVDFFCICICLYIHINFMWNASQHSIVVHICDTALFRYVRRSQNKFL